MDHDIILRYIQTLGVPVCVTIACGYALWTLGNRLIESHFAFVNVVKSQGDMTLTELRAQTELLRKWPSDFNDVCKAAVACKAEQVAAHQQLHQNQHQTKGGKNAT